MKPIRTNRQILKRVEEIQRALELADFYAFMLTFPEQKECIDDQTLQCVLACINNECHARSCLVYNFCPQVSWRISILN